MQAADLMKMLGINEGVPDNKIVHHESVHMMNGETAEVTIIDVTELFKNNQAEHDRQRNSVLSGINVPDALAKIMFDTTVHVVIHEATAMAATMPQSELLRMMVSTTSREEGWDISTACCLVAGCSVLRHREFSPTHLAELMFRINERHVAEMKKRDVTFECPPLVSLDENAELVAQVPFAYL